MRKLIVAVTAVVALPFVAAATTDSGAAPAACGNTTYKGVRARTYCGSASAVLKVGARTLRYRGGSCTRNRVAIELGIGTVILDTRDPRGGLPRSFGISVGRIFGVGRPAPRDGTYNSVMLVYVDRGKRYAASRATAVLRGNRTSGSFTGSLITGQAISGTFRCA